jgi:hypothetical protein
MQPTIRRKLSIYTILCSRSGTTARQYQGLHTIPQPPLFRCNAREFLLQRGRVPARRCGTQPSTTAILRALGGTREHPALAGPFPCSPFDRRIRRCTVDQSVALRPAALATDRSLPRGAHCGHRRNPRAAQRLLHVREQRRGVEDDGLRQHVDSDLRRQPLRLHRRDGGGALRSQHPLCGQRRRPAPSRSLGG